MFILTDSVFAPSDRFFVPTFNVSTPVTSSPVPVFRALTPAYAVSIPFDKAVAPEEIVPNPVDKADKPVSRAADPSVSFFMLCGLLSSDIDPTAAVRDSPILFMASRAPCALARALYFSKYELYTSMPPRASAPIARAASI